MPNDPPDLLKQQVRDYWNQFSCDTQVAKSPKFSREYFEQIESFRYADQPFIHSFAQFTRYHGKRVLEVGFGAGTDFIQWLRAGAQVSGIDLTQEAFDNLTNRIQAYALPEPEAILVGDSENLPFESNSFDLGYSFGVLHHSPNTEKAIAELVRVVRPGGEVKLMLYNRRSVYVFNQWIKYALLRGRPWTSLRSILWNHVESTGTKGYTRTEVTRIIRNLPLNCVSVHTEITSADYLSARGFLPLNLLYRICLSIVGYYRRWDLLQYISRAESPEQRNRATQEFVSDAPSFSGNPLGFFHCIAATKAGS